MKIKGFYNSKIYVYGKGIIKTSLLVEEGKISKIEGGASSIWRGIYCYSRLCR